MSPNDSLLQKILDDCYVDVKKRHDGSFGLTVDGHVDLTQEEVEAIWQVFGEVYYTWSEEDAKGNSWLHTHQEALP